MKLRTAIILDNLLISKWQKEALEEAKKKIEIKLILNCKNTINKRKYFKNLLYFFLNFISLKNFYTKKSKFNHLNTKVINFNSKHIGLWQSLPANIFTQIRKEKIDIVIKFGMNLLKIDKQISSLPILSFHHGDPLKYRGRPAGFYEILNHEKTIGVIVQRLNNSLDAGSILANASSKIVNYSYKKTSMNFYSISKFLLSKAIDNYLDKKEFILKERGNIYKLPGNFKVLKFILILFLNLSRKIFYGFFFEKKWRVGILKNDLKFSSNEIIISKNLKEISIKKKYNFYADPFFSCNNKFIRLEALNKLNGLGEILFISTDNLDKQKILLAQGHHSYPYSFIYKNKEYLLPEVASHLPQYFLETNKINKKTFIKGLEKERLVDSTLFEYQDHWYLFFGKKNDASTTLNLWISKSPFSEFKPHPKTPIVLSPKTARMAGSILRFENRLLRFGQNNEGEYGESLSIQEIIKLSPCDYLEKDIGYLKIDKYKGPHTINLNTQTKQIVFDYYSNKFTFFAGYRRIIGFLNKKIYKLFASFQD